eukprot:m.154382 g.154382  ORF g.154382 m.154382 type:complete len:76 (+) comp10190_c0_seq1:219-446(+)
MATRAQWSCFLRMGLTSTARITTPLRCAVYANDESLAELLLIHGSDIHNKTSGLHQKTSMAFQLFMMPQREAMRA